MIKLMMNLFYYQLYKEYESLNMNTPFDRISRVLAYIMRICYVISRRYCRKQGVVGLVSSCKRVFQAETGLTVANYERAKARRMPKGYLMEESGSLMLHLDLDSTQKLVLVVPFKQMFGAKPKSI